MNLLLHKIVICIKTKYTRLSLFLAAMNVLQEAPLRRGPRSEEWWQLYAQASFTKTGWIILWKYSFPAPISAKFVPLRFPSLL